MFKRARTNLPGSVHKQEWREALKPFPCNYKIGKPKPLFYKTSANEKELEEKLQETRKRLAQIP